MENDEARQLARAVGLSRLTDRHLVQLTRSLQTAQELGRKLPKDLHWTEEAAVISRPLAKPSANT
jgi:hypothetical protein